MGSTANNAITFFIFMITISDREGDGHEALLSTFVLVHITYMLSLLTNRYQYSHPQNAGLICISFD